MNRNFIVLFHILIIISSLSFIKTEWSQYSFRDGGPKPRYGHCMITVDSKYYNSLSNKQQSVKLMYRNNNNEEEENDEIYRLSLVLDSPTPTQYDDTNNNNNSYWIYGGSFSYNVELVSPPILMIKDRSGYFEELSFTSITQNPGLRWGHSCQLSGGNQDNATEILIFGGNKNVTSNQLSGELWKYSLITNSWILLSNYQPPPTPPDTNDTNSNNNSSTSSSTSSSNNSSIDNSLLSLTSNISIPEILPFGRSHHSSTGNLTSIFIFGGITNQSNELVIENDFWIYNIKNQTWKLLDKPENGVYPSPRYGHTMVLAQEIIYIFGGFSSLNNLNTQPNGQLWVFNIKSGEWNQMDDEDESPGPRGYHSMVLDSKKESAFFVYGGENTYIEYNDLWIYDIDSESWESIETSYNPPTLKKQSMTVSSDFNGFLMYGGGGDPSLFYTYGLDCNCNGRGGCFYGVCSCFTGYFGEYCQSSIDGPLLLGLGLAVSVPILCFGWCVLRCTTLPTRMKILTIFILVMSISLFVSVESCLSCWLPEALMGVVSGVIGLVGILKYKSPRVILYFLFSVFATLCVGAYGLILFITICMMGNCRNDKPNKLWLPKYAIIMSFVHMAFLILVLPLSFKLYKHRKYMQRISNSSVSTNNVQLINNGFLFTNQLSKDPINSLLKKIDQNNSNGSSNNSDEINQKAINYLQKEFHLRNELNKFRLSKASSIEELRIRVDRNQILEDTYSQMSQLSTNVLLQTISIKFIDEVGVDMGGLRKEWFSLLFKQIFEPSHGLFVLNSNYTLSISPNSHLQVDYLSYFLFAGKMVARSVIDGIHLDHTFSRTIYKLILGKPPVLDDLVFVDPAFHKSLIWILENSVDEMEEVTFSTTQEQIGVGHVLVDLKPGGRDILVDEENKQEFVDLMTQWRFQRDISDQAYHFIQGFREIIPLDLISNFTECELELFICGLIEIDVEDWKQNTVYRGYTISSSVIEWFWEILEEMEIEDRIRLLQFVTGNARLPPSGFQGLISGDGIVKFQIHKSYTPDNQLPVARTCFNRLDLPNYDSKESLKYYLNLAIKIGLPGFGLS